MRKVELSLQERRRGRKISSLMGKSDASERNESWLSNCRVQFIFCKNDTIITFFKIVMCVTACKIVGTL